MQKTRKKEVSDFLKLLKANSQIHKNNYEFFYEVDGTKFEDFLYLVENMINEDEATE